MMLIIFSKCFNTAPRGYDVGSRVLYFILELGFDADAVMKSLACSFGIFSD